MTVPRYALVIFDFDGTLADTGEWFLSGGDETRDIVAAKKVGVASGAVLSGYTRRHALLREAPGFVFDAPDQIARLVLGQPAAVAA